MMPIITRILHARYDLNRTQDMEVPVITRILYARYDLNKTQDMEVIKVSL